MSSVPDWLTQQWAEENVRTLHSMTDVRPSVTCEPVESDEVEALILEAFLTQITFSVGTEAAMWLAYPRVSMDVLGRRTLTAAGIEDGGPKEIENTFLEIVQQSHSGLAQSLSRRLERSVQAKGTEADSFPTDQPVFQLSLTFPDSPPILAYFTFSTGLLDAFETTAAESTARAENTAGAPSQSAANVPSGPKTIDVLLEVSMPVSVSFGRTELLIKDVLKLTNGSIIELKRSVSEPVEVIVNDRIIARGEVVVVDGNYGVRIGQIVSPQERFRSVQTTALPSGKSSVIS